MADKFNLDNVKGLLDKLSKLDAEVQKKISWSSLRKGAAVVQKNAIENAKKIDVLPEEGKEDSKIYPFIKIQKASKIAKNGKRVAYRVGVQGGAVYEGVRKPPTYWRFVEMGTEDTKAKPFLRPAIEKDHVKITNLVIENLWSQINKKVK